MTQEAIKQAKLWNDTQEPRFKQILLDNVNAVRNSFLYTAIPSLLMLVIILAIVIARFSPFIYKWARRTIRLPRKWKGEFDRREKAILLPSSATLTYASFGLAYTLSQLSTIQTTTNYAVIWEGALVGAALGIFSFITVVWNLFKPRRATASAAVAMVLCAIALYMIIAITVYSIIWLQ